MAPGSRSTWDNFLGLALKNFSPLPEQEFTEWELGPTMVLAGKF